MSRGGRRQGRSPEVSAWARRGPGAGPAGLRRKSEGGLFAGITPRVADSLHAHFRACLFEKRSRKMKMVAFFKEDERNH